MVTPPARLPAGAAAEGIERLRQRGHRGGAIAQHRALHSLRWPKERLATGFALALALTLALLAAREALAAAWAAALVGWLHALDLPGSFDTALHGGDGLVALGVPTLDVPLAAQGELTPALHGAVALAVWWLAGQLPDAARPATYLLRFAMLIHGTSIAFFWLWPASFPHSLSSHVASGLRQIWALMLLTPWLHFCTYYPFPFAAWQRAALSAVTLAWLAVLAPLQYALHIALLHHLGPIAMPLLHLLFGVMVSIIGFVALYGWAMSWRVPGRGGQEG